MKVMALTLLLLIPWLALAQAARGEEHGFLPRIHRDSDGQEAKYVLFVPYDYTGEKPYPLVLFLHGISESGNDGHKQVEVGLGPVVRAQEKTFPFITIFPQSQKRSWQNGFSDAKRALAILDEVEKQYRVDPKQVYLTGLSMGGYGVWSLAIADPQRWAAIVPICGGGDSKQAGKIKDIPCWCFHGSDDKTVRPERSRAMIEALRAAGAQPKYTEYPGVGHESWEKAYATPELFTWLAEQHQ